MSLTSAYPPPTVQSDLSLVQLLVTLARERRLLLKFVGAGLLLGVLLSIVIRPYYTATTSFLPPQQSSSSASSMLAQLGGLGSLAGMGSLGMKSTTDLYVGLLASVTVEDAMVSRFHLKEQYKIKYDSFARRQLEQQTKINGKEKDGLVRVSVTDKSPERAAQLANGYLEQLQKMSGNLAVTEASQRRRFLELQLADTKTKLTQSEEDLRTTEQKTGVIQVEGQARVLIEAAAGLRAQIAAKEVQLQSMRTYAGEGNPDLMQAEQELSGLRSQLARLNGGSGGDDSLTPQKAQLTTAGFEYMRRLREAKYQETMFAVLARQYEAAKLDEAREGSMIQIVDRANPPDYKSGPKRLIILVLSCLLGFFAGVAYILGRLFLGRMRADPEMSSALASLRQTSVIRSR